MEKQKHIPSNISDIITTSETVVGQTHDGHLLHSMQNGAGI